jgi:hypothetical protein
MTQKKTPKQDDSVVALIRRTDTEKPNPEDLKRLRDILDENDALVRINETSEMAFTRVIGSYTKSELSKELFKRQIEAKRKSLNYESENVIVQMLINQVILCHIRLNTFEAFHAEKVKESLSIASGLYWDKLLLNYQKRFQKACEILAKVKKVLSEAELRDEQAQNKRSQSTLASQKLYKMLSD